MTHEPLKARFPRGVITYRNPQRSISEGPTMASMKEGKLDRDFPFQVCIFDKAILLERTNVSTLTRSHDEFVSIYSLNKYSDVNVSPSSQMFLSILSSCCKKK